MNGDKLALGVVAALAAAGFASRKGSTATILTWSDAGPATIEWAPTEEGTYFWLPNDYDYGDEPVEQEQEFGILGYHLGDEDQYDRGGYYFNGVQWVAVEDFFAPRDPMAVEYSFVRAKKAADAHYLERRGIRSLTKKKGSSADARYPSSARRDRRTKLWSPDEATEVARAVSRRLKRTKVWGENQLRRIGAFLLASEQRMNEINLELLWKYFAPEMRFWKRGGTPSLRGKPKYADAPDGAWEGNYEDVIRRVGGFGTWGDDGGFGQRELVLRSLVHARAQDGLVQAMDAATLARSSPHPGAPSPQGADWFEKTYFRDPLVQEKSRLRESRSTVLSTQYDLRASIGLNPRTGERR
ncbi:hypothetical protein CMI47_01230 [Candidatus Pacearchaeota archaeon]|nr:hypothetical protein [Candidatus Pacearchaeota archaeon]